MSVTAAKVQEPVVVDIKEVIEKFGSHFNVLHDKSSTNQVNLTIFEKIGPVDKLNVWSHQHSMLSSAINHINMAIQTTTQERMTRFEKEMSTLSGKIVMLRHKLGLFNKGIQERLDDYIQLHKEDVIEVNNFSQASEKDTRFLEGSCRIPKYMPKADTDYFLVDVSKLPALSITTVRLFEVDVYEHFNSYSSDIVLNDYDIHFAHKFVEVGNPEGVWEYLKFESLARYNGVFYNLSSSHNFLFNTYEDAVGFVAKQVEIRLSKLELQMQQLKETQQLILTAK